MPVGLDSRQRSVTFVFNDLWLVVAIAETKGYVEYQTFCLRPLRHLILWYFAPNRSSVHCEVLLITVNRVAINDRFGLQDELTDSLNIQQGAMGKVVRDDNEDDERTGCTYLCLEAGVAADC